MSFGMMLAGAAKGMGDGLMKQAEQERENALMQVKRQWQLDDAATAREQQLSDYDRNRADKLGDEQRGWDREDEATDRAADVITSLFGTESGGNFGAANDEGYVGRGQFGQERLDDFAKANGTPRIDIETFRKNPGLQKKVEVWHFNDIEDFIDKHGLVEKYEGKTINGVKVTRSGMIAAAHLGGQEGMRKLLESDGKYDPADSNKTRLSGYMRTHGGLSTPRTMDRETARVYVDPKTPSDVRTKIGEATGLGGKREKLTGHTWMENADGVTVRMAYNPETGEYEEVPGAGGKPKTGTEKPATISATVARQIKDRFTDKMMKETDDDAVAIFSEEVLRLVEEEGLSDQKAFNKASLGMGYEQIEKPGRDGIFGFGKREATVEKGDWDYTFNYDQAPTAPTGLGGKPAAAPAPAQAPEPEIERGLPAPKSQAEYEALPSGTRYVDPNGEVRTKQ